MVPILDVTVVGETPDEDLAQRVADAVGRALEAAPGRTWVRVHALPAARYAEDRDTAWRAAPPVFVSLLLHDPGVPAIRAERLRVVTDAVAEACGRPRARVHVRLEAPGAGRIAFGGEPVPPLEVQRLGSGAPWEDRVGYARVVRADDHVWVTGTTATLPDGGHTGDGDPYAQTRQVLDNIAAALDRVGASLHHVVRTRIFVVDIARDWEAVGRAHAEVFGACRPATSMVEVGALIAPWMLVEIEAQAYLGA